MARNPLRPIYVVSKKEFKTNLLSIRMVVLLSILALVVVGGSYGLAGLQVGPEQLVPWAHPIVGDDPTGVTVFVSDAWGVPHVGLEVQLARQIPGGQPVLLDTRQTDSDGFVKFLSLPEGDYRISASLGSFSRTTGISLFSFLDYGNLSFGTELFDLDNSGLVDDFAMHFMDTSGEVPSGVTVLLDGTEVGPPDSRGYLLVKLREGTNNLTIAYKGETRGLTVSTMPNPGGISPFAEGSDIVLFIIAITFGSLLLPIVAIALSYDSIAKEKAEGSADLLLYRPASWRAVAVGKFLGVFSAIALPVTAIILTGVFIITAVTGTSPSFATTSGFIAFTLFLLAVYILLMQSLSTVAKTAGTAILFGIVLWFVFNLLWNVIIFLVSTVAGLPIGSRGYLVLASYLSLFNPSTVYLNLFLLVAPQGLETLGSFTGISGGIFALPIWALAIAAVSWLAVLFVLFLEIFRRKAAG